VRVLTDTATALDDVVGAVRAMLDDGPALTVLPAEPVAWRARVRHAVRPERDTGPALVVATSGSSGDPVGVVLGADAVRWSAEQTADRLGRPAAWVLALPLTHVAGLMVLARAVATGAGLARLRPGSGVPLGRAVHDAADRAHAGSRGHGADAPSTAISLVPTQVRRLLADDPSALRRFSHVLVGGAALDPSLRAQAEDEAVQLVASYGMTETCGGFVHDGVPLPSAQLSLDSSGLISVDGPMLATAYRGEQCDEPLARPFATKDMGHWEGGRLVVVGRADDVVTTGGVSVPLPAVDALLRGHPDVADAAAVALPDAEWGSRIVGVVVAPGGLDPAALRAHVARHAEAAYVPQSIVVVDGLPRPAPDKVDRDALVALVQEG
jgi:O-succinylbenzoic acid--CoA ligase